MSSGDDVRSLLKDVSLVGAAVVLKKKLLWMLGWGQDRPGAWKVLLDHWVELGEQRNSLRGFEVYDKIVLTTAPGNTTLVPVTDWED